MPSSMQVIGAVRFSGLEKVNLNDGLICIMGEAFAHCDCEALRLTIYPSVVSLSPTLVYPPTELKLTLSPQSYAEQIDFLAPTTIDYLIDLNDD